MRTVLFPFLLTFDIVDTEWPLKRCGLSMKLNTFINEEVGA